MVNNISGPCIFEQINWKGLCKDKLNSALRLKNILRAFSFDVLDIDGKLAYRDSKKLKLIIDLRKDLAILKPAKGNGVVNLSNSDCYQS